MPLLNGELDPVRFNSTVLGMMLCESLATARAVAPEMPVAPAADWSQLAEEERQWMIDVAQFLIDGLAAMGVVR